MKSNIIKVIIITTLCVGMHFTLYSLPQTIYGAGGKVNQPDGSQIWCPQPVARLCAKVGFAMSGNATYPDLAEFYGPTGILIETREIDIISIGNNDESVTLWPGPLHSGSLKPSMLKNETETE